MSGEKLSLRGSVLYASKKGRSIPSKSKGEKEREIRVKKEKIQVL